MQRSSAIADSSRASVRNSSGLKSGGFRILPLNIYRDIPSGAFSVVALQSRDPPLNIGADFIPVSECAFCWKINTLCENKLLRAVIWVNEVGYHNLCRVYPPLMGRDLKDLLNTRNQWLT
jgi:hypothetical protein